MAQLTAEPERFEGPQLAIGQLRAIAWLRWRILANGFRRKGGAGELIARILLFPFLLVLALLPTVTAGTLAWYFTSHNQLDRVVWILWAAVALTQLVNINLGQAGTAFDPTELIRFPMPLRRFVLVRLCFGLLAPGNLIVSFMSVAVVIGLSIARPSLWAAALVSMTVFAIVNVLFTRMIFAWIDRWLSTRRAREIFTAFVFISSIGIQYLNVRFNPGFAPHHRHGATLGAPPGTQPLATLAERLHPYVLWMPPELTAGAILAADGGRRPVWLVRTLATIAFAALFLAVYALRMRSEFRGENLSDVAIVPAPKATSPPVRSGSPVLRAALIPKRSSNSWIPGSLLPLLGKELLVLRRNVGLFYGLVAPAVMVFLFAGRVSSRGSSHWVLLGAVAYALLGIAPMSYNSFGYEGTGAQLYFFAPLRLRDVFLAKNIFGLLLALLEIAFVMGITAFVAGRPHAVDCVFALLWAVGTVLINTTIGNLRSVAAPKIVNPGRTLKKAQSAVSGYIAIGILLGCGAFGFGCEFLGLYLNMPWLGVLLMAGFAAAGVIVYVAGLRGIETYTLERRDTLFEELGKKA